jgi:hypothetical protein
VGIPSWPARRAAPVDASAVAHQLLHALADVDHRAFVAPAGGNFKKLPEDTFLRLVVEMTRWRVVFAGGGKDATLTFSTSGGTVRLFTLW